MPIIIAIHYPDGDMAPVAVMEVTTAETALRELGEVFCNIGEYMKTGKMPPAGITLTDLLRMANAPNN